MASEAEVEQVTEKCRTLEPGAFAEWSHLRSRATPARQWQVYIEHTFNLGGDDENGNPAGPFQTAKALVASGRTAAEALEMFHAWHADEKRFAKFFDAVIRAPSHFERQRELDKQVAQAAHARASGERMTEWLRKKADYALRSVGLKAGKVQV